MYILPLPELKYDKELLLNYFYHNFHDGNWDHPTLNNEPIWQMMRIMNFDNDSQFKHIIDQFLIPINKDMFRFIKYVEKSSLSIHRDERKSTINIILEGDNTKAVLGFYDKTKKINLFNVHYTDCPLMIDTRCNHDLKINSFVPRTILSITFNLKSIYDFDTLYNLYRDKKLLKNQTS